MCDFDYSLIIEFERLSVSELRDTLDILYYSSSECYREIELLADEVIIRLDECKHGIKERKYRNFKKLIIDTFDKLKKISDIYGVSDRIKIIYDKYNQYMLDVESPVASPVVSPKKFEVKVPKIMKKNKRNRN